MEISETYLHIGIRDALRAAQHTRVDGLASLLQRVDDVEVERGPLDVPSADLLEHDDLLCRCRHERGDARSRKGVQKGDRDEEHAIRVQARLIPAKKEDDGAWVRGGTAVCRVRTDGATDQSEGVGRGALVRLEWVCSRLVRRDRRGRLCGEESGDLVLGYFLDGIVCRA